MKDIVFHKEFGKHLSKLIKDKGLKPETIAAIGEIETKAVYRVINAEHSPTLYILKRIANGLGITLSELFDFKHNSDRNGIQ